MSDFGEEVMKEAAKGQKDRQRAYFNIVAEAKMLTLVQMAKKYVPADQVQQFCEAMLNYALKKEGVIHE